jgi:hypothetical protein
MRRTKKHPGLQFSAEEKEVFKSLVIHFKLAENEQNDFMLDQGVKYINQLMQWTARGKAQLLKSKAFWTTFALRWKQYDIELAETMRKYYRSPSSYEALHLKKHLNQPLPNYFWKELNRLNRKPKRVTAKVRKA